MLISVSSILFLILAKIIPVVVKESLALTSVVRDQLQSAVTEAASIIKSGGVIAVPTDTLYGLACDAGDKRAVDRMFDIKRRNASNPVAICVGDVEDVKKWCQVSLPDDALNKLLPGQVSLVFKRHPEILSHLNPGVDSLAVRVPDCDFIRDVCRQTKGPLALTSANISAARSSLCIEDFKDLWPEIDTVFDAGDLSCFDPLRAGSTVVVLTDHKSFHIRRKGCASELVERVLKSFHLSPSDSETG